MASKIDENVLFHYYILDPKRRNREKKYALIYIICSIAFIIFVIAMYSVSSFDGVYIGSVPVIAPICWAIILISYIFLVVIGGSWVLDLKNDAEQPWTNQPWK